VPVSINLTAKSITFAKGEGGKGAYEGISELAGLWLLLVPQRCACLLASRRITKIDLQVIQLWLLA